MKTLSLLLIAYVIAGVSCSAVNHPTPTAVSKGVAVLNTGGTGAGGNVTFTQYSDGSVQISGQVTGLNASSLHGFHVHEYGDLSGGCDSAGVHFNPDNTTHGAQTAPRPKRHVGDLGNIDADESGTAEINIVDKIISLRGRDSIIGRALVVHSGQDDLGLGGNAGSLANGNSGTRVACGVVGIAAL